MLRNVKIDKEIDENGKEIVHSVQIETTSEDYDEKVQNIETVFYYKVDKASGISVNPDSGAFMKIIYKSEKPLNYDYYHKKLYHLIML